MDIQQLVTDLKNAAADVGLNSITNDPSLVRSLLETRERLIEYAERDAAKRSLIRIEALLINAVQRLDELTAQQAASTAREVNMEGSLERLEASVAAIDGVIESAVAAFGQLSEIIRNTQPTQEALNALADDVDNRKAQLAKAINDSIPVPPQG